MHLSFLQNNLHELLFFSPFSMLPSSTTLHPLWRCNLPIYSFTQFNQLEHRPVIFAYGFDSANPVIIELQF